MGVGALALARKGVAASAYTLSRNVDAEKSAASDGSEAAIECSRSGFESLSARFGPMDRKMTSSASCVKPR